MRITSGKELTNKEVPNSHKKRELIKALEEGEQSGFIEDFDPKQHLKRIQMYYK